MKDSNQQVSVSETEILLQKIHRAKCKYEVEAAKRQRVVNIKRAEQVRLDRSQRRTAIGLEQRMQIIAHGYAIYERVQQRVPEVTLRHLARFLYLTYVFYDKNRRVEISEDTLYDNIKTYRRKKVGKF